MDTKVKKVAFNTIYLYISSFLQLLIGLYTSRVLLSVLGIKDFGLYGVVGSIVTLLGFLNIAMGGASSRYMTYELANGSLKSQRNIYSTVVVVHSFLAFILLLLAETFGLYYVIYYLDVPIGRMQAALWCYQASIFVAFLSIIQVPYNALINAHERMGFSSIWQTLIIFFRLLCTLSLYFISIDKLIYYALVIALVNFIGFLGFVFFCKRHFEECVLVKSSNSKLYKEILSFASFSAFSSSSNMIRTQGTNLLVNKFFGVAMNASVNIATTIYGYIYGFSYNVIAAFRPQIIKKYAKGEIQAMQNDMELCMKYCVAIFSFMAVPIFIDVDFVLRLWLGNIPPLSSLFTRIGLCGSLFALLNIIFTIGIQATSKVKDNSLYISFFSFLSIVVMWIFLKGDFAVYFVFLITAITEFLLMGISFFNFKKLISDLKVLKFCLLFVNLLVFMILSSIVGFYIRDRMEESLIRFLMIGFSYVFIFSSLFFFFLINKETRGMLFQKIKITFNL